MSNSSFFGSSSVTNLIALANLLLLFFTSLRLDEKIFRGYKPPISRRAIIACCFAVFGILFAGIGFYGSRRLEQQLSDAQSKLARTDSTKAIQSWSANMVIVDTALLSQYGSEYRALLMFRLEVRSIDYLTDRAIMKSYLFDIDGSRRSVEVVLTDAFWSRLPSSTGFVHVYLAILPKSISSDRISCLADVTLNQGRILADNASAAIPLLKKQTSGNIYDTSSDRQAAGPIGAAP